jgi:hypothetical protein
MVECHYMFRVIEIEANAPLNIEAMGTKRKFWFQHPELGFSMFKLARPGTGEDWSEKIAEQMCGLLGLPHARYELGISSEGLGVVSPSFVPNSPLYRLLPGNELLKVLPGYQLAGNNYRNSQHTVDLVLQTLQGYDTAMPQEWIPPDGVTSAADVFVGYLLLDTWIGNTDRHHENWAVVEQNVAIPERHIVRSLAPTHDHASSLGCHESDEKRQFHLTTPDPHQNAQGYAGKARSALYLTEEDRKPLLTIDAFREAGTRQQEAANAWLRQLEQVTINQIEISIKQVPTDRISAIAAEFAKAILVVNQQRLLHLRENL